ncbi:hypothetical protein GWI33_004572 [Rhynchophorus ferrugineus]|uniref:MARVEL domain-containing protein n=1 Tax=Rhynchophorus ferrugineus TaxID=354439 RepID=A0A834II70_RHYFE|nr:hypothetical protein GWI33_004572 [Rhynchophorus ferrugineus]
MSTTTSTNLEHLAKTEEVSETDWKEWAKDNWQLLIKIGQLVICIICLGSVMEPAKRGNLAKIHLDHFAVIFTTFVGYLVIISVCLFAKIIGDKIPYRTLFTFSSIASCLFFITGVLLAVDRKRRYFHDDIFYEPRAYLLNLMVTSSVFAFFGSAVFTVEAVYIWKYREDF